MKEYDLGSSESRFNTLYISDPALDALNTIAEIELSHMTYDSDENRDGEWEYEAVEVDDGTVQDNYSREIEIIRNALDTLNLFKSALTLEHIQMSTPTTEIHDDGSVSVAFENAYKYVRNKLDEECKKALTQWVIENIDKEKVREWLDN